jgi:uncharacterized integral membrane protein
MNKPSTKQIINLSAILVLLVFAAQNIEKVKVKLIFWGFDISLIILIAFVFLLGLITGHLFLGSKKENKCVENENPKILDKSTENAQGAD